MTNRNKSSGQDAFVVSTWIAPGPFQGAQMLGVADGVGGWARYGVDSKTLSHGLCSELQAVFLGTPDGFRLPDPRQLLNEAFTSLSKEGAKYAGGTTACVAVFDPLSSHLRISNIGDSQAAIIRDGRIIAMTPRDTQGMVPRQLVIAPDWLNSLRDRQKAVAGPAIRREPWIDSTTDLDSIDIEYELESNDVILIASDGLWDNVHLQQIERLVGSSASRPLDEFADLLLERAYYNSLDPYYVSPYAIRGLDEGYDHFSGGKPDDITIVAALVAPADLDPHGLEVDI